MKRLIQMVEITYRRFTLNGYYSDWFEHLSNRIYDRIHEIQNNLRHKYNGQSVLFDMVVNDRGDHDGEEGFVKAVFIVPEDEVKECINPVKSLDSNIEVSTERLKQKTPNKKIKPLNEGQFVWLRYENTLYYDFPRLTKYEQDFVHGQARSVVFVNKTGITRSTLAKLTDFVDADTKFVSSIRRDAVQAGASYMPMSYGMTLERAKALLSLCRRNRDAIRFTIGFEEHRFFQLGQKTAIELLEHVVSIHKAKKK